jgi:hypothetical protein
MKNQGCILHKTMLAMFVVLAGTMGYAQLGVKAGVNATIPFHFAAVTQNVSAEKEPRKPAPPPLPCSETGKRDGPCLPHPPLF